MSGIPVRIHPDNPKVFEFRGRPLVLLTATEHYGAVLNRPFRYDRYLRDAASRGMTLTRLFMLFRELQSPLNPYSTCKPESTDYVAPYPRTGPGSACDGLPKYDLDQWNPEFFERLHGFLSLASELRVVVELTLLSNTYDPGVWSLNPLNARNNINQLDEVEWQEYMTPRNPKLAARQMELVRKVVQETNGYDNVLYEVCNEPGGGISRTGQPVTTRDVNDWQKRIVKAIRAADKGPAGRHLIAGQEAFTYEPWEQSLSASFDSMPFDIVNVHPLPNTTLRGKSYDMGAFMSGQLHLRAVRDLCIAASAEGKPVNLDEDNVASRFRDVNGWTIHRKRAWVALMSGAHYDVIDFSIQCGLETGTSDSRRHIRSWFRHLSSFIHSMDLAAARPALEVVKEVPHGVLHAVLADEGKDYCIYLADERELNEPGHGKQVRGTVIINLPPGRYAACSYSPVSGRYHELTELRGGDARISVPRFKEDLVLRIRAQ